MTVGDVGPLGIDSCCDPEHAVGIPGWVNASTDIEQLELPGTMHRKLVDGPAELVLTKTEFGHEIDTVLPHRDNDIRNRQRLMVLDKRSGGVRRDRRGHRQRRNSGSQTNPYGRATAAETEPVLLPPKRSPAWISRRRPGGLVGSRARPSVTTAGPT